MTKITKEKTAKIIPNAVGVCTEADDVKHIFASLLSRDSTFKLMTSIWKRAIRSGRMEEDLMLQAVCTTIKCSIHGYDNNNSLFQSDAPDGGELDDDIINESSDSEKDSMMPSVSDVVNNAMETSYVVKRMSQSNGTMYYQTTPLMATTSVTTSHKSDSSGKIVATFRFWALH